MPLTNPTKLALYAERGVTASYWLGPSGLLVWPAEAEMGQLQNLQVQWHHREVQQANLNFLRRQRYGRRP